MGPRRWLCAPRAHQPRKALSLRHNRTSPRPYGDTGSRFQPSTMSSGAEPARKGLLKTMNAIRAIFPAVLFSALALAQNPSSPPLKRQVHDQTIFSSELPTADLIFEKDFRYVGGQVVNLYGNADAEQYLFAKGPDNGPVQAFCWVQFEHFLPTNKMTYDYKGDSPTDVGGLSFLYNVKSFPDYAGMEEEDPRSDGAAIARLLAQHGLAFPKRAVRVRLIHLPTPDHRTELMIIYGEAVPDDSKIPVRAEGLRLDDAFPEVSDTVLERARRSFSLQRH